MSADGSAFGIVQPHVTTPARRGAGVSRSERYLLEMRGVPFRATLKPGAVVYSSGLGGIYPQGIPDRASCSTRSRRRKSWARTYLLRPAVNPARADVGDDPDAAARARRARQRVGRRRCRRLRDARASWSPATRSRARRPARKRQRGARRSIRRRDNRLGGATRSRATAQRPPRRRLAPRRADRRAASIRPRSERGATAASRGAATACAARVAADSRRRAAAPVPRSRSRRDTTPGARP